MSTTTATDYRQAVNELHGFGSGYRSRCVGTDRPGTTWPPMTTSLSTLPIYVGLGAVTELPMPSDEANR